MIYPVLKSFDELKKQYDLPKTQFWRYLQIRHALQKSFESNVHSPKPAVKLDKILQVLGHGHEAAKYYRMLMAYEKDGGMLALRIAWEKDLGVAFGEQDWARICGNSRLMSRDLRVRLIQFKILH